MKKRHFSSLYTFLLCNHNKETTKELYTPLSKEKSMDKGEMLLVINDTILNFKKDIQKPFVFFLSKERFSKYLDMMQLEKHINKTPCFVAEMKGGDIIYYCEEIINCLTKDFSKEKTKLFLQAITLHELLHMRNRIHVFTGEEAVFSEKLVDKELKAFYPRHHNLLLSITQSFS